MDKTPKIWRENPGARGKISSPEERAAKAGELGGVGAYVRVIGKHNVVHRISTVLSSGWVQLEIVQSNRKARRPLGQPSTARLVNPLTLEKAETPAD
ncbi:MAG: hypothetical protein AAB440_02530 [Patescibacteria group bacterium]